MLRPRTVRGPSAIVAAWPARRPQQSSAAIALRSPRRAARLRDRLDGGLPLLLRPELLRLHPARTSAGPVLDAAAHLHRHPVPGLRRRRAGDRQPPGPAAGRGSGGAGRRSPAARCWSAPARGSMFPRSCISFGVLHGIAVMLIVVRFTASWGDVALAARARSRSLCRSSSSIRSSTRRATDWIGLVTHLPVTEDYVPVLPWLGVMWWGAAATDWLLRASHVRARRAAAAAAGAARLPRPLEPQLLHAAPAGADRRRPLAWLLGRLRR